MNTNSDSLTSLHDENIREGTYLILDPARESEAYQDNLSVETQRNINDSTGYHKVIFTDDALWRQTAPRISSKTINSQLLQIFSDAREEVFESGMESSFSKQLINLINKHDVVAMDAVTDFILSGSVNAEVAAETMRWLGLMESSVGYRQRRWLLARCLRASSERVRDAASLGLSYLDDPWAIPYLKNAAQDEQIPELRHDMEQVLQQLKNTLENAQ